MKKDGYSENTLETFGRRLRYLAKNANLGSPESVKEFIAEKAWSNGYKDNMVSAYNHYVVFHSLSWKKPKYQRAFSIKKLPLEANIDLIISYTKTRNRVAFKLVKECGLRPIEVSNLTLKQIDLNNGRVYPETAALIQKYIGSRSEGRLIDVESGTIRTMIKRVAKKAGVRNAENMTPHKLRHFFACDFLQRGGDVRSLQKLLGHAELSTTEIYLDYTFDMVSQAYNKVFEKKEGEKKS